MKIESGKHLQWPIFLTKVSAKHGWMYGWLQLEKDYNSLVSIRSRKTYETKKKDCKFKECVFVGSEIK